MKKSQNTNGAYQDKIVLHGVRTHNLKNIDVELPKNKIITVTGVSGSGKSSLAFHTIYKEGQFRYIESLSSYLRGFFNLGTRPEIDYTEGLSPAIAIEQNKHIGNSRSTVGTLTEIDDYLRLLFAKLGDIYCYKCGKFIKSKTADQIVFDIKEKFLGNKVYILQEIKEFADLHDFLKFFRQNRKKVESGEGFVRYLVKSQNTKENSSKSKKNAHKTGLINDFIEYFYLEDPQIEQSYFPIKVYGIYDRVTIEEAKIQRLKEDIIKILGGAKKFGVYLSSEENIYNSDITWYTDKNFCPNCNITYPEFTTQHFSPNRQEGACEKCHGLGQTLQVDFNKIIDPFSGYTKAILPWRDSNMGKAILEKMAQKYGISEQIIWKDLPDWFTKVVLDGDGELMKINIGGKFVSIYYNGVEDYLTQQYQKGLLTVDFQAMLEVRLCPECNGAKLKKESLNVFIEIKEKKDIQKYNIFDLQNIKISDLGGLFEQYKKTTDKTSLLTNRILNPLLDRTKTIEQLGVSYITLYRQIDTLSGGEIQRLRLAKQLGNKLSGIIYVLDEPTIGLDEGEIKKTIKAIQTLKDMGNTIIVVEHNDDFIKASDWVVEIGPGAGDFGGKVVFNGAYSDFIKQKSLTSDFITGKKKVDVKFSHNFSNKLIQVKKACKHNLKNINIDINLGSFTIITGPSGAGKTTIMYHTLYKFLSDKEKFIQGFIRLQLLKQGMSWSDIIKAPTMKPHEYESYQNLALEEFHKELGVETIKGFENIKNVIYVDQTSIGKTPRSCPATFIGVFDDIRKIYAGVTEAQMFGFSSSNFSFNSGKGACPECEGYGYKKIELQFLPDTYVPCSLCHGKRYKPEILGIKWHGKNISELLDMYVEQAYDFFEDIPFISEKLQLMKDIGLGYLKMGQPAHTLSGGESQRLKLIKHLLKSYKGHSVYFLDEPTVGLHPADIEKLLNVLKKFLDKGDTILMIEHDKNLLKFADKVIHLDDGDIK